MAALSPSAAACPGCIAAPNAPIAEVAVDARLVVSLPSIHCQACISGVERALRADPRVHEARVNLTLKRAMIEAAPEVTAQDMVDVLAGAGFEAHELDQGVLMATQADTQSRELLMRLAVAGFAAMNVMLLSVAVWAGAADVTRDMFHWISAAITLPAIGFAGQPFFRNAWSALKAGRLNMDVPITLAIVLALATSLWETMLSGHHAYFDAALTLVFFLLAGRYLDHRTRAVARSAAQELAALEVPRAVRVVDGVETVVAIGDLALGDLVLVRPGGRMPVDGRVVHGQSEIDRSLLTGETLPVFAGEGHVVSAGEVNLTGPLTIEATAVGEDTSLHRLADLVAIAESGRSRYTSLADSAAKLYAPGVHILSALAFAGWWAWSGDLRISINIAAAVLIITCPCALGLAVPAVTTAASGRLFKKGLLIKDATALERLAEVDMVVFDKTGTLTQGTPQLVNAGAVSEADLELAFGLAQGSDHPLSRAIVAAGLEARVEASEIENRREVPGFGSEGTWQGTRVRLGRAAWVGAEDADQTATYLQVGDAPAVPFLFVDALRKGAAEAVAALIASGRRVVLLSGDAETPVRALAAELGIAEAYAQITPEEKARFVEKITDEGCRVLMVGDGLNDTGALRSAHVSISPASALDAARVASDIVLLGTDLSPIADGLRTAASAKRRIKENFSIATIYNVIAVPVAIIGLATPLIAALAMSASSITVSLNAMRLKG